MIDKDNKDITVKRIYSDGSELDADGWTIRKPGKTKWGTKNTYVVEYKDKNAELVIETDKSIKQVGESAKGVIKKGIRSYEYKTLKTKINDSDAFIVEIEMEPKFYQEMQDYWFKGEEMYSGTMQDVWEDYKDRFIKLSNDIQEHFSNEGYGNADITINVVSPKGKKRLVIDNGTVTTDYYGFDDLDDFDE